MLVVVAVLDYKLETSFITDNRSKGSMLYFKIVTDENC